MVILRIRILRRGPLDSKMNSKLNIHVYYNDHRGKEPIVIYKQLGQYRNPKKTLTP